MYEQALKRFRDACGVTGPLVFQCEGSTGSGPSITNRTFACPFALVGRDPDVDLVLDNPQVSRRHAFLHATGGRILVTDLQSRTNVYWGGEEAPRSRGWLDLDEFIQIGGHRIRWTLSAADGNPPGESPESLATPPEDRFEAGLVRSAALELPIRIGDGPPLWPVEGDLALVGRSDVCQLVLTDESISRFHAALLPTPLGLWVVDLLAREGVHVNGERVRWAWLADGDALRLGRFTFILRYETAPDRTIREDVPLDAGAIHADRPGTALAVRPTPSDNGPRALTVRSRGRSLAAVTDHISPRAVEPDPLVPARAEVWESSPFPANPMVMWQQQMQLMESFHNDMIMMVQMFVAMHKEHSASVRHELDMVQHLTRELSALQARTRESADSEKSLAIAGTDRPSGKHRPVSTTDRETPIRKPVSDQPNQGPDRTEPKSREPAGRSRTTGFAMPPTPESAPPTANGTRGGTRADPCPSGRAHRAAPARAPRVLAKDSQQDQQMSDPDYSYSLLDSTEDQRYRK